MEQVCEGPVADFLRECTITGLDESEATPAADLYGMYIIWCEQAGLTPVSTTFFSRRAKESGIEPRRRNRENIYTGLLPTGPIPVQYILETDKPPSPNGALSVFGS
ncbi:primase-like DNA-binding domain-containing protein [Arthrobacter sp. Edens01]|uniref:primase-like DNA-binding domain-containing protein n=1 Tax=Arthrobacter sp. Edens01 TaxID=1732020 RepID=UPI0006D9F20A|nr:primase-like DNA-binding domain-containing protein [Arthrobacter sp. Edens01]KPN18883.1 hypothetical protein AO716_14105 [Arthrobacter sp. Edens01]